MQLNQVADALKTQAEHHFVVGGHTDNQGTDRINDDLSARRAMAVRDYLVVRGVSANAAGMLRIRARNASRGEVREFLVRWLADN